VSERPGDADEADLVEQRLGVDDDLVEVPDPGGTPFEADEADALEQQLSVPIQDDDYPDYPEP
jgi:hypothetical protein